MFSDWYNWYYYTESEIKLAKYQIEYYKKRIEDIEKKTKMSEVEKLDKIAGINLTIDSLIYTYSLYDLSN